MKSSVVKLEGQVPVLVRVLIGDNFPTRDSLVIIPHGMLVIIPQRN